MERVTTHSGKLRGLGYDRRTRVLEVEMDDGRMLQYSGVGEDTWRRLRDASSPWSFYRDNIEEEFSAKTISGKTQSSKNPLDDLFGP